MLRLVVFVSLVGVGGCASTGATPRPFPTASRPPAVASTTAPASAATPVAAALAPGLGYSIVGTALALQGIPYRNGGTDPAGFDCSGFVKYVFEQHGVAMPRNVVDQFQAGAEVNAGEIQPGDLVFFTTTAPGASHVGIAIGGDQFVHAPSSNGVVRVERFGASYWAARLVGAKRITN